MKKTYIIPAAEAILLSSEEHVLEGSVKAIGGDSGLEKGDGDAPATADVKTTTVDWQKWD